MRIKLYNSCAVRFPVWHVSAPIVLAIALTSCSSAAPPLAIRMYNPKTQQTLHCTARSKSAEYNPILANTVEACARQLEASGFVRDN